MTKEPAQPTDELNGASDEVIDPRHSIETHSSNTHTPVKNESEDGNTTVGSQTVDIPGYNMRDGVQLPNDLTTEEDQHQQSDQKAQTTIEEEAEEEEEEEDDFDDGKEYDIEDDRYTSDWDLHLRNPSLKSRYVTH